MKYLLSLVLVFLVACNDEKVENAQKFVDVPIDITLEQEGAVDPIANPKAVAGGTFTAWGGPTPKSLNAWLENWALSGEVSGYLFESLVTMHPVTDEPVGVLAESWETSKDGKSFTFTLHPKATWSDGKPITVEDIQFYYDVIMNKKNKTSLYRVQMSRFQRPEKVAERTVRITSNDVHWRNFWDAAGFVAFPKHVWEGVDFNKQNWEFPVVSGPYYLKEVKKNRYITLKRREYWWGRVKKFNQNKYNIEELKYRFIVDQVKALEMLKKGDLDVYAIYSSKVWNKHLDLDLIDKNWIIKQKIYNDKPMGFQGLVFNLRREKFQDVRIREAICLLVNRDKINEKLMYNEYLMINSYYPDLYPSKINPDVPVRKFNPIKARALFAEAGWLVNAKGILEKEGKEFTVTFTHQGSDQRHMNIVMEDFKSVGIKATLEVVSFSTFSKKIDEHNFDMVWRNWGASRLPDPEASWHSKTAMDQSTNNLPGYKNATVDSLIELQKTEFDAKKRKDILREIDAILYNDIPYSLLWNANNVRMLYWNKFGTPEYIFDKFGDERSVGTYWWYDSEKDAALKTARKNDSALPAQPKKVLFK